MHVQLQFIILPQRLYTYLPQLDTVRANGVELVARGSSGGVQKATKNVASHLPNIFQYDN